MCSSISTATAWDRAKLKCISRVRRKLREQDESLGKGFVDDFAFDER